MRGSSAPRNTAPIAAVVPSEALAPQATTSAAAIGTMPNTTPRLTLTPCHLWKANCCSLQREKRGTNQAHHESGAAPEEGGASQTSDRKPAACATQPLQGSAQRVWQHQQRKQRCEFSRQVSNRCEPWRGRSREHGLPGNKARAQQAINLLGIAALSPVIPNHFQFQASQ